MDKITSQIKFDAKHDGMIPAICNHPVMLAILAGAALGAVIGGFILEPVVMWNNITRLFISGDGLLMVAGMH